MSANVSAGAGGSQPSPGTQAVAVLSDFRAALLAGQRPRIEDFLPGWGEPGHSALLRGLVTVEVAYRLRHGERPTMAEYRARFPGQDQAIEEAYRHPSTIPRPGGSGVAAAEATGPRSAAGEGAADQPPALDPAAAPYALSADPAAVRRFGDYELQQRIDRDEVGVLYRARQVSVDRIVALKTIMADGLVSDANVQQFYRDTRAVAALDHPGIVPIFDVGEHEGQHFVSMGFIEGETLAKKKTGGGLGLREGVEVIRQVAETIAYAHGKGVVHRNLTPKNILLNARGRPKVTGFSSSASFQSAGSQTMPGRVVGMPGYLAPEQVREGQDVGPAADIHALGAVLYFVLTGRAPFQGPNLVETLLKVLHRDPKPPRRLNPNVPPELEAICLKCLQKRPGRRFASAAALAEELGRWSRNEPVEVREESPIFRSGRLLGQLCLSHPRVSLAAGGVLAVALACLAAIGLFPRSVPNRGPSRDGNLVVQRPDAAAGRPDAPPKGESAPTDAQARIVSQGKQGVALVEADAARGVRFGSAFCIDISGLFVTAAHVVEPVIKSKAGAVRLVVHDGELRQKVVPARVIRSDAGLDLAVLKLEPGGDVPLVPLELGQDGGLVETAVVTAFGYPLGTGVPHDPGRYPSVSVNLGHITALSRGEGGLSRIQLDAALNPGNSGGPVLDREGRVIGVVSAGIRGASGLNYAIPVDQLNRFLRSPEVVFDPPPIRDVDLDKPVVWTIDVRPPTIGSLPRGVDLAVRLGRGPNGREATVKRLGAGRFQAEVVPSRPPDEPIELNVSVRGKSVVGRTINRNLVIGGQNYALGQLSLIQRLEPGARYRVLTGDGKELSGPVDGLGTAEVPWTASDKPLDLTTASSIRVRHQGPPAIEATVEVRAGSDTLATARRKLAFVEAGRPGINPPVPGPIQPPARPAPTVAATPQPPPRPNSGAVPPPAEIRLPGEIDDLAVGGDRYLILMIKSPAKLLIFDAAAAAIVKELPLTGRALVAAGSKSFVVVHPDQGVFQTWDFATMAVKKQENLVLSARARIEGIAMGSQTEGPLLVIWDVDTPSNGVNPQNAFTPLDPRVRAGLIDPDSLKLLKIGGFRLDSPAQQDGPPVVSRDRRTFVPNPNLNRFPIGRNFSVQVRASAQGDLFTVSTWNGSSLLAIREPRSSRSVTCFNSFGGQQSLIPVPDGRRIFTGTNQTVRIDAAGAVQRDDDLPGRVPAPGHWRQSQLFPSEDPGYFLLCELDQRQVSVLLPAGEVLLKQSLPAMNDNNNKPALFGKRLLLFPQHELLVIVPNGEDHLLPRRIPLRDALSRLDHPVVVSPSDVFAVHGQTFSHQIRVLSKAGGVTFSVPKGFAPANMKVSPDGKVTWPVPPKSAGQEVYSVIQIKDGKGREVTHRLNILVR